MKINQQQGVALVISLIMLLLLTLLGVYAMRTSTMEEKMASNNLDHSLALLAAETALRDAEEWITDQDSAPLGDSTGSDRVWTKNAMAPDTSSVGNWWQERGRSWWENNAIQYTGTISTVNTNPYTIIEYLQKVKTTVTSSNSYGSSSSSTVKHYYRITALGTGATDQSRVLLQTTYYGEW